jgi:hypothetical protein
MGPAGDVLGRDGIGQPDGHTWCERALVRPLPLETARVVKISQPDGHTWCERALVLPLPLGTARVVKISQLDGPHLV